MARDLRLLPRAVGRLRSVLALGATRGFSAAAAAEPLHVCVVGSGPAGFYTADRLLKGHEGAQVDIIDRLPTPFGLVRSGVAPDHPETKVVLAYGAESDRSLGIPGEDLKGIHSAREFVWWYNGHPDMCNLSPDLKNTESAVVLGQGNVALDVARILLRCKSELATTDITEYALDALRDSRIRKVYLVGRRGPVQAACTAKELREILGLKNVRVCIKEADLVTSPADEEEMRNSRIQRRVYELLSKAASAPKDINCNDQKELHFVFFRRPIRFIPSENGSTVGAVELEKTTLKGDEVTGRQLAVGTGEFEDLKCGSCTKFERQSPKQRIRDGNSGNRAVASILEDDTKAVLRAPSDLKKHGRAGLVEILEQKNVRFVPFSGWEKIDSKEKTAGQLRNKPREKITTWDGLQRAANE
nr:unnamed protein product [Digitaria exilis]